MAETIVYERSGRIGRVTLNRPEKLNAISRQLQRELLEALVEAERDAAVHVALVSGAGRAFSAGYDLTGAGGVAATQASVIARDRDGLEELLRNWLRIWTYGFQSWLKSTDIASPGAPSWRRSAM